jgi:hypothetical protein
MGYLITLYQQLRLLGINEMKGRRKERKDERQGEEEITKQKREKVRSNRKAGGKMQSAQRARCWMQVIDTAVRN